MTHSTSANAATTEVPSIEPRELYHRWRRGESVEIIDVRFPASFTECHVPDAESVPYETLDPREVMARRAGGPDDPLYVICQIGVRSVDATRLFLDAGFTNVVNVAGGTRSWQEEGLPVVHPRRQGLPLRRQVQLTAGAIAAGGSALGLVLGPVFMAIPAVIGAGLVYTAVTDNCVMGMALAKMPWNRAEDGAARTLTDGLPRNQHSRA